MTEAEWLECTDPMPMLEFLRGWASDRKLRLYLCESYRTIPSERLPGTILKAILAMERHAEGQPRSFQELLDARSSAWQFAQQNRIFRSEPTPEDRLHRDLLNAIDL